MSQQLQQEMNSGFRFRGVVTAVAVLVVALLVTGCPEKPIDKPHNHGIKRQRINIDSAVKASKAIRDSVVKIAPALAIDISIDSLRKILRVGDEVDNPTMMRWMELPPTIIVGDDPPNCEMILVHFTDTEVSQLFIRVASQFPDQINNLIAQMGPTIFSGQPYYLAPNVYSRQCNPAIISELVPYSTTEAQTAKWAVTSSSVKSQFMAALNAFRLSAGVSGTRNILWISNLNPTTLSTNPYTNVVYTTTSYNASTRIHVIQLVDVP